MRKFHSKLRFLIFILLGIFTNCSGGKIQFASFLSSSDSESNSNFEPKSFQQEVNFTEKKEEPASIETIEVKTLVTEAVEKENVITVTTLKEPNEEPEDQTTYSITPSLTEINIPLIINKDQPLLFTATASPASKLLMTSSDTSVLAISNEGIIRTFANGSGTVTISPESGLGSTTVPFEVFTYPEFEPSFYFGKLHREGQVYPTFANFTADDKYIMVSDNNLNRVRIFEMEYYEESMYATYTIGVTNELGDPIPSDSSAGFDVPYSTNTSPDGHWLAVADGGNHRVQIFDISNGFSNNMEAAYTLGVTGQIGDEESPTDDGTHFTKLRNAVFTPDSKYLAVTDRTEHVVKIFNIENGFTDDSLMQATYIIGSMYTQGASTEAGDSLLDQPYTVAFTPDGNFMAIAQFGNNIIEIFDISDGFSSDLKSTYVIGGGESAQFDVLLTVSFSPDGRYMLTSEYKRQVQLFDISNGFSDDLSAVQIFGGSDEPRGYHEDTEKYHSLMGAYFSNKGDKLLISDYGNHRIVIYETPML